MMDTTIYIATHKEFNPPLKKGYVPIVAGAHNNDLTYLKDNTGDNISNKNPYYCELTAWYWIWKNDQSKYVGLDHYHRYFFHYHMLGLREASKILAHYDFIVPMPFGFDRTVYLQYAASHYKRDLNTAVNEMIKRDYKYRYYSEEVLNRNYLYACNMFVTSRELLDDYFSFLFPLLLDLESKIPYKSYDDYQRRIFGFLSERIFNIYLARNNLYLKEYPVLDTDVKRILK